jgi:hypothetical protein
MDIRDGRDPIAVRHVGRVARSLDESHCASIAASCLSHMTIAVTRLSQPDGRLRRANRGERI